MFIRKQKRPNGKVRILLVESYRIDGKVRQRNIKYFGTEDELNKMDPNFVNKLIEKYKNEEESTDVIAEVNISLAEKIPTINTVRNYGNYFLERMYVELGLDRLCEKITSESEMEYSLNDCLKLLCFMRALNPASKKSTQKIGCHYFLEDVDIKLETIYKALTVLAEHKTEFVSQMHKALSEKYERKTEILYYDVTNYYFEIDQEDEFRKKGCSKEYRPSPIIQMGLFMDNNGLPVDFYLYEGNMPDCCTLKPSLKKVKKAFNTDKIIITADKGLNSNLNIGFILSQGNGYIVSQRIRHGQKDLVAQVMDEDDWISNDDGSFKIKEFIRTINVQYPNGSSNKHEQKVVCIWSKKYADKEKSTRDKLLEKVAILAANPSKYKQSCRKGMKKYIDAVNFNPETGEIFDNVKTKTSVNTEKIAADEVLDGYYLIVSSETKLSVSEIITRYRGLWRIEQSFQITKSDIESRPVFVRTEKHILAHFLTCFITLAILRMLEIRLQRKFSCRRIINGLNSAIAMKLPKAIWAINKRDEVVEKFDELLGLEFNSRFVKSEQMRQYCSSIINAEYTTLKK